MTSQWQQVLQQHRQKKLPQALLLLGAEGIGKTAFAKKLAQLVLCEFPGETACGQCRQCHLFEVHAHPDYFYVEPQEKSRVIKIDQVRELINQLNQTPQLAQYQVAIINPLESLNLKAANALLKTLEEPAGNVLFLLICHRLSQVPATVLSRCQKLSFYAQEEAPLPNPELREQLFSTLTRIIEQGNPLKDIPNLINQDLSQILLVIRSILMDVCKCQLTHIDKNALIQRFAQQYTRVRIQEQLDLVRDAETVFRMGVPINPQLMLESLLLSFAERG